MGKEKTTVETGGTQTTTPEPTAAELEMQELQLGQFKQTAQPMTDVQLTGLDLIQQLLSGGTDLPGFFGEIGRGISPELTTEIAREAVGDIPPQLQSQGLLDSGVGQSLMARTSGDIRRATGEFNIGNKLNLLNLALSGQAQVQQPMLAQSAMLGQQLAGLRGQTTTGTGTSTTTSMNPFLKSFQTSMGAAPATFLKQGGASFWG